nr:RagB/SusD family nutrient uptake outer membrane protein [Parabacteroides sp. AM08-6]
MKTKNILKYIVGITACTAFASCNDYLDKMPDDQKTEQDIFTHYDYVDGLVTNLYEDSRNSNKPLIFFRDFSTAPVTDECAASQHEGATPHQFNIGNWGPVQGLPASTGQYWWDLYARVRKANIILEGIAKYNTPDNPRDGRTGDLSRRIGETFFLRGYLYYLLIRMYGEVPYVDKALYPGDNMNIPKSSYHELVEKICMDADSAYNRVYDICPDNEFGRVDKGACLGLKAMVRWMAATPMWNGGTMPNDTRVFKDEYTYDEQRWVKAKEAAKAVIDFQVGGKKRYSLYTASTANDYKDWNGGDGTTANNKMVPYRLWNMNFDPEAIRNEWVWFGTRDKNAGGWCGDVCPPSMNGHARQRPLQEQVDEYEIVIDGYGYPIYSDKAKGVYDDANPYVNRDPRFYRDIIYHGATFNKGQINTAEGSDRIGESYQSDRSHTGYYLRKFIKESWTRDQDYMMHGPAIFRLPTIMYIYCEAVNNTTGPSEEIYNMVNEIRARSFMAPMPPEVKTNKALMNEYIQRERRVELFYENDRIWHCRLYLEPDAEAQAEAAWKALGSPADYYPYPKTQRTSHGMRPVEDPNGKIVVNGKHYRMERFRVKVGDLDFRVFQTPRHYLFPIMDDELKRSPSLEQNPGWD